MLTKSESLKSLQKIFLKQRVVNISSLSKILQTQSRMSIFRRLKEIGYFSSFSHAGKYYTLTIIPQFDENGLWFFQEIGFSRFGTLKATIIELVCGSSAGLTHLELNQLLRIKVYNSLLGLVKEGLIGRERIEKSFLYVAPEHGKATEQINRQKTADAKSVRDVTVLSDTIVIEVLIETINAEKIEISPSLVAKRLSNRGMLLSNKQVEQIFNQYGIPLEKKIL
jgi:hypothetical protein